jgi:hypothetical protein
MRNDPLPTILVAFLLAGPISAQQGSNLSGQSTSAATQPAALKPARATIADVAWIAGTWTGSAGAVTLEERWTPPAGGAMLGVSRTIKQDRMIALEFLRIIERNGGLLYVAQPNGVPPTEFTLTSFDADSATFENPAHDYPKIIRYAKKPDGTLEARISGAGGQRPQTFLFTRQVSGSP